MVFGPARRAVLFLALAALAAAGAFAQDQAAAAPPAPSAPAGTVKTSKDTIIFSAGRVESILAKGKERTILSGGARVQTGSMEIKADRIELSGEDYRVVSCSGTVSVVDTEDQIALVAASLTYDRETEIGLAEKGVELNDSKNKVILDADWLKFDQKESIVEARTAVHILKEDFAVRSEFATFNRKTESLELSGLPVAATQSGTMGASKISGSAAGAESLEFSGRVTGTITSKKKEGTSP